MMPFAPKFVLTAVALELCLHVEVLAMEMVDADVYVSSPSNPLSNLLDKEILPGGKIAVKRLKRGKTGSAKEHGFEDASNVYVLRRGDFRKPDVIMNEGFTAKYNDFVRVTLFRDHEHRDHPTIKFLEKLLPLAGSDRGRNLKVSELGTTILEHKKRTYMKLHVNTKINTRTMKVGRKKVKVPINENIIGVFEALPETYETILSSRNLTFNHLREFPADVLKIEHSLDQSDLKNASYQNFVNILQKMELYAVATGHTATNWPELISAGHIRGGDCKGDHIYEIRVPLREVTREEAEEQIDNDAFYGLGRSKKWWRMQRNCKLWVHADAPTIRDSDIFLYSDNHMKEFDFVHTVPVKYITYVPPPKAQQPDSIDSEDRTKFGA